MSDVYLPAIAALQEQLAKDQRAVSETKKLINKLSELSGVPVPFTSVDEVEVVGVSAIRPDTFYGKKLATALREYLEMRRAAGLGPAETREIYDAVAQGGFQFDAANVNNAMTGIRQLMTKNTNQFHKLPNGAWGLASWYENIKASRKRQDDENPSGGEPEEENGAAKVENPAAPESNPA